jgi:hypothetical protein
VLLGLIVWPRSTGENGALGPRVAKGLWAALWLGSAALWLMPANLSTSSVHDQIAAAPSGVSWLTSLQHTAAAAAAGRGVTVALGLALISAAIGLGVLSARWSSPALAASVIVAMLYWILGQGLGGIFTGSGTDPNTGPLLVLLAAAMYGLAPAPTGPRVRVGAIRGRRASAAARLGEALPGNA